MQEYINLGLDEHEIKKIKDIIFLADKTSKNYITDFLSPSIQAVIPRLFYNYNDLDYKLVGGYDGAEYKVLVIGRYLDDASSLKVISIKYNSKYNSINHRDVLGSILALGLKRNKIGDILISESLIEVIVSSDISEYIAFNLQKIKRARVEVVIKDKISIEKKENIKALTLTISSLRLDNIISSSYNISRKKAKDYISMGIVKVNHLMNDSASYIVKEHDLISVKKKGRISLNKIIGLSKKNKYKVEIYRYL